METSKLDIKQQFVHFLFFGCLAIAIELGAFIFLLELRYLDYRLSTIFSFIIGASFAFVMNKKYTFFYKKDISSPRLYLRYLFLNLIGLILDYSIVIFFVRTFRNVGMAGSPEIFGKALSIVVTSVFVFFGHRMFTFRN